MTHHETQNNGLTILEHLTELRKRITYAVLGLLGGTIAGFFLAEQALIFLLGPYDGEGLQTLTPTANIEIYFKVSLTLGAIFAMPFMLLQFWLFIAPGLHRHEKKYVYIFIPSATLLFLTGVLFTWYILLPAAIAFLQAFLSDIFTPEWVADEYISFVTTFMFWLGMSFQMPVIIYFVARLGLVQAKTLRSQWRLAIVLIAVVAAVVTPSVDPVTMLLTMAPLTVLYIVSTMLASVGYRQHLKSLE